MNNCKVTILALLLISSGCGVENDGRPSRVPVTGFVSMDGQSVEQADVIFSSETGGPAASAMTDSQGKFLLSTFGDRDGAIPGSYRVIIKKQEEKGAMTTAEAQAYMQRYNRPPPGPSYVDLLPSKYADLRSTDLKVEVEQGRENTFAFELNLVE